MDKVLSLKNLEGIESFTARFARLGDLYVLFHVDLLSSETNKTAESSQNTGEDPLPGLNSPFRLDGMLFVLVSSGELTLQVNADTHTVSAGNIFVVRPGALTVFTSFNHESVVTVLFISSAFLNNIKLDIHNIELRPILSPTRSVLKLSPAETSIVRKYFDILDFNACDNSGSVFAKLVAETLISSMVYEILRFARTRMTESALNDVNDSRPDPQSRAHAYVFRFMQLLHIHYAHHRTLPFYARQLCITPKYLSMLTREITGQSANEWINRVVIQEAKNLLRFSDKNIQEIAYALNFPSQSAFGKYFRRVAGKSPGAFLRDGD